VVRLSGCATQGRSFFLPPEVGIGVLFLAPSREESCLEKNSKWEWFAELENKNMATTVPEMNRRGFLAVGAGAMALAGVPGLASAAELTSDEQANVQLVNEFCAAWPSRDLAKVMAFFADDGAYRMTETTELADGRDAVSARIQTIIHNVDRFEVLDTFARGPMVINERIDHFSDFSIKTWHGVGVFFIRDGKIVDWYDYTITMEQA
jgi:limonene-1,2-epoxide hydrolase